VNKFNVRHFLAKILKSRKFVVGTMVVIAVIGSMIVYFSGTAYAAYISVNGQRIGIVASVDKGQQLVDNILIKRGQSFGKAAKTHDSLGFEAVRVKKGELLEVMSTDNELQKVLTSYIDGVALDIAGTQVAILPSQADAQTLLKTYQEEYTKPSDTNKVTSVEFSEAVVMKPTEAQPDQVKPLDQALKQLKDGKITTTEYTAKDNDSWWLIARENDMKTDEVLAGNPGMTEDSKVKAGQKINLISVIPYLTVMSKGTLTSTETIPYEVVKTTDTTLDRGNSVIKEQGSEGSKVVTYAYSQKNGETISQDVLEEKVSKQPVTQVVSEGPGLTAVTMAVSRGSNNSAKIAWPIRGPINSPYGSRWGKLHNGLDIGAGTGRAYCAAASGTVVTAGWGGGYGNMILIDHGNGVTTRYGHSSKLLVSAGDHVEQGETIGLVGSTGHSTGPHLHFEVMLHGSTVNPANYLR